MTKLELLMADFEKAVHRLEEVLSMPKSDVVRDSAIQRFEFTLDLAWKTLKAHLEENFGVVVASPKKCFREAFHQGIIDYDEKWLEFIDIRNEIAHTYNEQQAENLYSRLVESLKYFQKLLEILKDNGLSSKI